MLKIRIVWKCLLRTTIAVILSLRVYDFPESFPLNLFVVSDDFRFFSVDFASYGDHIKDFGLDAVVDHFPL